MRPRNAVPLDTSELVPLSPRKPPCVNVVSVDGDETPQYELLSPRQRTIDGRWEPTRARAAPVSAERPADDRTGDLFGVGRGQRELPATRPQGGLEREGDNVFSPPLGDVDAAPKKARSTQKRALSARLRAAATESAGEESRRLWRVSEELGRCGVSAMPGTGDVTVRSNGKARHLSGVLYCGRHLCPSCGPFAASRRREALEALAPKVVGLGRHVHVVFTLRHRRGVEWSELRDVMKAVWRGMVQSRLWTSSVLGFIRADETTFGKNGHHFHTHAVLTLRSDVDVDAFRSWIEAFWRRRARQLGRTAEWHDGWWSEIAPEALLSVVRYGTKQAAPESSGVRPEALAHVVTAEVLGGSGKRGSAPWDLPAEAYAEVWFSSKRHRWFAVGGCWRSEAAEAVETEEGAAEQRETHGTPIATRPREDWRRVPREFREWLIGLSANRSLSDAEFLSQWEWFWATYDPVRRSLVPKTRDLRSGSGSDRRERSSGSCAS